MGHCYRSVFIFKSFSAGSQASNASNIYAVNFKRGHADQRTTIKWRVQICASLCRGAVPSRGQSATGMNAVTFNARSYRSTSCRLAGLGTNGTSRQPNACQSSGASGQQAFTLDLIPPGKRRSVSAASKNNSANARTSGHCSSARIAIAFFPSSKSSHLANFFAAAFYATLMQLLPDSIW